MTRSGSPLPALGAQATSLHAAEGRESRSITDHMEVGMPGDLTRLPLVDLVDAFAVSGECRHDPELHTGPDAFEDEPAADRLARQDIARELCESCPVWAQCLDYALRTRPAFGVWAGYLPYELAALSRQVRRLPASAAAPDLGEAA